MVRSRTKLVAYLCSGVRAKIVNEIVHHRRRIEHSRSQLAEDAGAANVLAALGVGLAHVALHALVVGRAVRTDVRFHHRNASDGRIADRVLLADRTGGQRSMRERRLQRVQQVNHDADELRWERTVDTQMIRIRSDGGMVLHWQVCTHTREDMKSNAICVTQNGRPHPKHPWRILYLARLLGHNGHLIRIFVAQHARHHSRQHALYGREKSNNKMETIVPTNHK